MHARPITHLLRMLTLLFLSALLLCLFLSARAFADPLLTGDPAVVELDPMVRIAVLVVGVLAAILAPLAVVLGRYLARRLETATGLDLTEDVEGAARSAVGLAEQMAVKRLSESHLKIPGGEKLAIATAFFLKIAEEKKWPDWVKEHATSWIESHLGQLAIAVEAPATTPATGGVP